MLKISFKNLISLMLQKERPGEASKDLQLKSVRSGKLGLYGSTTYINLQACRML